MILVALINEIIPSINFLIIKKLLEILPFSITWMDLEGLMLS